MKTHFDFAEFLKDGENFLRDLVTELKTSGLPAHQLAVDHLCFRVGTGDEYVFHKEQLLRHGELLTEASVNGRPICTFRLHRPFQTEEHRVPLLELPAPKPGFFYESGFEHAEFLIQESFENFAAAAPLLSFQTGGNKTLNHELRLPLAGRQAKFHHLSLDRVIEIEEARVEDVIFDLDGTLIKSREVIHDINRLVFSEILEREVSRREAIEKFHPEFSKLFVAFSVTCPRRQHQAVTRWGDISQNFSYDLFDGARELLESLSAQGFRLHLWTARDETSARKILRQHRIEGLFATLSFATAIDSKPHAGSLKFDWKSTPPNRTIVIGDSPSDIRGARNIGALRAAALWDPHVKKNDLVQAGAELFFHQLSDLASWFSQRERPSNKASEASSSLRLPSGPNKDEQAS